MDVDVDTTSGAEDDASSIIYVPEGVSVIYCDVGGFRRSLKEGQLLLEHDLLAREVEPHQVICKSCDRWIGLNSRMRYRLHSWQKHVERTHGQALNMCYRRSEYMCRGSGA